MKTPGPRAGRFLFPVRRSRARLRAPGLPPGSYDGSQLSLYNAQGQLIASCDVPGAESPFPKPKPCVELVRAYDDKSVTRCSFEYRVHINRRFPDIAYAFWGGHSAESTRSAVNKIAFRRFQDCGSTER